ncbi:hypothetical protein QBC46DRAFT_146391 [Diplogelasinospora grovesii]|uniref:Uncharacterized protein n=1 Tax=Diplogelasinospora grovesii TaxID=303347 RepID=A0AAN6NFE7_9PEZI|nr:hypothetical protein QBC46DRAFT_146391 [Diplogelasinospora grovesii]
MSLAYSVFWFGVFCFLSSHLASSGLGVGYVDSIGTFCFGMGRTPFWSGVVGYIQGFIYSWWPVLSPAFIEQHWVAGQYWDIPSDDGRLCEQARRVFFFGGGGGATYAHPGGQALLFWSPLKNRTFRNQEMDQVRCFTHKPLRY